jgi:hypothetical protein
MKVRSRKQINGCGGSAALTTRHPSIRKSLYEISLTSGGYSVGIVCLQTKGHRVCFLFDGQSDGPIKKTFDFVELRVLSPC